MSMCILGIRADSRMDSPRAFAGMVCRGKEFVPEYRHFVISKMCFLNKDYVRFKLVHVM